MVKVNVNRFCGKPGYLLDSLKETFKIGTSKDIDRRWVACKDDVDFDLEVIP